MENKISINKYHIMHNYRLTRRGKVVITVFALVMILSIINIFSINQFAIASDNSENELLQNTKYLSILNIDSNSNSHINNINFEDNPKNDFLSIPVEDVNTYSKSKVAFLTFDDGPSENITPLILDILDDYNIKATFFVLGKLCKENSSVLKDISIREHAIGIHSYSHNYNQIYKNKENFIKEIKMTENVLKEKLGENFNTRLFRFPGGSFDNYKNQYKTILNDEGYVFIDWNVINGDGELLDPLPAKLLDRLKVTSMGKKNIIILMHDSATKKATANALPKVIEYLKSEGYEFAVLK